MRIDRTILAGMTATALLLATTVAVVAQEEDRTSHPLVGSWLTDVRPGDPENPLALDTFFADGTIRHSGGWDGAGSWRPTGARTADMTLVWVQVAEDGAWGTVTVRGTVEVSEDGQTWSGGEQTLEFSEGMGDAFDAPVGEFGPLPQPSAQRINVEPMDPDGPMPGPPGE